MEITRQGGILTSENLMVDPCGGDVMLAYAYLQFRASGLLPVIFPERVPTLTDFLVQFMGMQVLGCYLDSITGPEMVGLGWLNSVTELADGRRRAEIGFGFFPSDKFGHKFSLSIKLRLGRMMLAWAFEDFKLDVLVGTTPVANRGACLYANMLRFRMIGPLPQYGTYEGQPADYWQLAMTRRLWEDVMQNQQVVVVCRADQ